MRMKLLAILLLALVLFSGLAIAATPTIAVLNRDGNFYYPSKTTTINWTAIDTDDPTDFNFRIFYVNEATTVRTEITTEFDMNSNTYCSLPVTTTGQICSYDWTIPTGLDANYYWDINGVDATNSDDANSESGSVILDSNACDTGISVSGDQVTLTTYCTGWGMDANGGSVVTSYGYTRVKRCPDNYGTYSTPFNLSFGEFMICYYSTDGIGNTEITQSHEHKADSDAVNIALLTEMALAGLLLFVILGGVLLRNEQLSGPMMITMVVAAVVIAVAIYIFAVVL